jgi:hypothetical protein
MCGLMLARRAAHVSIGSAALAAAAALQALVQWSSGSPGPALGVSVVACLVGFAVAVTVEAAGTDRRDLRLGLAGLIANLLIATFWAVVVVAAYAGS